jgi:hypothetical protein
MAPNSEDYDAATYPRSGQHRPRMASRKKNLQHAGLSLCTTPLLLELRIGRGRRHGRQRPRSTAGCSSIFRQICRVNHRGRHPGFYPKAAHTETVPKSRASLLYPGSTDFDGGGVMHSPRAANPFADRESTRRPVLSAGWRCRPSNDLAKTNVFRPSPIKTVVDTSNISPDYRLPGQRCRHPSPCRFRTRWPIAAYMERIAHDDEINHAKAS